MLALCDLGCPIDSRSKTGETALHIAVSRNRYDCAMGLVIRGADAAAVNNKGYSALHLAVEVCVYALQSIINSVLIRLLIKLCGRLSLIWLFEWLLDRLTGLPANEQLYVPHDFCARKTLWIICFYCSFVNY